MNPNSNKFDFDFGIGSKNPSSKSLNDQKPNPNNSHSYSYTPKTTPSWTHQPGPSQPGVTRSELGGGSSMVGDITGKSWNSAPKVAVAGSATGATVGVVNKNPNLFGDLLNSALGQSNSSSNVPLKSVKPVSKPFSMGGVADSLPKSSSMPKSSSDSLPKSTSNAGSYGSVGLGSASVPKSSTNSGDLGGGASWGSFQSVGIGNTASGSMNLGSGLGGGGMNSNKDPFGSFVGLSSKPMKGSGGGGGMDSNKDPFRSFVDLSSKSVNDRVGGGGGGGMNLNNDDPFGSLVDLSSKPINDSVVGGGGGGMNLNNDPFGSFLDLSSKPMKNSAVGGGVGMNLNEDSFGSFADFTSKPVKNSGVGGGVGMNSSIDPFGSFGGLSSEPVKVSGVGGGGTTGIGDDFAFGDFQNASKPNAGTVPKMDSFGTENNSAPLHSMGADPFDMFYSSTAPGGAHTTSDSGVGGEEVLGGDDWRLDSGFGGHVDGSTTELDGLPPPPAGVSGSTAKTKGLDNYKQGQFADAIRWLSWAEVLLEKAGETDGRKEVLSCRASCYKEVGEYKKAVADCTKILDHDGKNVAVLVQRALLYESMEKYRLGADDLRTVMKLDPGNRVARSTIHRLNKMAE